MLDNMVRWFAVGAALVGIGCSTEVMEEELAERASDLRAPKDGEISFGKDTSEGKNAVPITKNGNEWRVIFSVPVEDVRAAERIAVRGEVTLSKCTPSEGAPCNRDTPFNPQFSTRIVLGDSANDTGGSPLSDVETLTCTKNEHHCTLVVDEKITTGLSGAKKFVNLIVAAKGSDPNANDVMKVENKHGGVYVTRMAAGVNAQGVRTINMKDVSDKTMKIDNVDDNSAQGDSRRASHVIFREKIDVQPGDVLDVDGTILAKVKDAASCDPLIMHQVFVSKNENPEKSEILELTAQNGTNCVGNECKYKKSGAGELPANTPKTVWVSVVAKAGRSCTANGDTWSVGASSQMKLRIRR